MACIVEAGALRFADVVSCVRGGETLPIADIWRNLKDPSMLVVNNSDRRKGKEHNGQYPQNKKSIIIYQISNSLPFDRDSV